MHLSSLTRPSRSHVHVLSVDDLQNHPSHSLILAGTRVTCAVSARPRLRTGLVPDTGMCEFVSLPCVTMQALGLLEAVSTPVKSKA